MMKEPTKKLTNQLEYYGFNLEFPEYSSEEESIIDILNCEQPRTYRIIPIIQLFNKINDKKIIESINLEQRKIYKKYSVFFFDDDEKELFRKYKECLEKDIYDESLRKKIIGLTKKISDIDSQLIILDAINSMTNKYNKSAERKLDILSRYNLKQSLDRLFSKGKQKIMTKLENREELTLSEYNYYSDGIKPILESIMNENLRQYCQLMLSLKKHKPKNIEKNKSI